MTTWRMPGNVVEEDPITPVSIQHKVDEYFENNRLMNRYNFVVYRFVLGGAEMHARCYMDDAAEVSILGSFVLNDGTAPLETVDAPELHQAVVRYLARRFNVITELHPDCGYQPIWIIKRPSWMSRDEPWPPGWRGLPADDAPPLLLPESPPHA